MSQEKDKEKCIQNPPTPSKKEVEDNIPNILRAMGIQSCKNVAGGGGDIFCGCGFGFSVNIGCEQISVISEKFLQTTNIITCILNTVKNTVETSAISENDIKLTINGNMDCDKGVNFNFNQTSYIDLVSINQVDNNIKNDIVNQIKDFIQETMKSIQDSKTDFLSTPGGQKSIQDALNSITKNMDTYINNNVVTELLTKASGENKIELVINGNVKGSSCNLNFNQQSVIVLTSQNLISTVLTNAVKNDDFTKFLSDMSNYQKSEASGLGNILGSAAIIIILMIVGGLVLFGGGSVSSIMKYIIPITIIAAIIVAVIFGKNKNYMVAGISGGAAVLLIVFEFLSLRKTGGISKNSKKSKK